MKERQPGFYWVRPKGSRKWTIGQYYKKKWASSWTLQGSEVWFADISFETIGRKIKEPCVSY